jgi:hypothetical protein
MSITMVTGAEPPDGGGEQLLQPGARVPPPGAILGVPNCQARTTFHLIVKSEKIWTRFLRTGRLNLFL